MTEESDPKKRKTEEEAPVQKDAEMKEEPAEPEPQKELEEDFKPDKRAALQQTVLVETRDATLNVIPALGGRVLMPLTDGGLQYLVAGARANVGIKKGRYLFEVKIVETHNPAEPVNSRTNSRAPMPRQLVRVGFSTRDSSLFLGETEESFCFDSEGFFTADKKRVAASQRFSRDQTIAVLLNLDRKSPNADTVSLFRDGERVSPPQPLPECLQDKALFPHVNFKNVTLHMHFGPVPLVQLPFTCKTVQEAAKDDTVIVSAAPTKDERHEVLFPVGLPDEGTFDWLDGFLEKNPQFVELSDRSIVRWAERSGLWRPKTSSWKNSADKPDMNFGIPLMDDFSVRRVVNSVIASQPRNYVVMEVKSNLISEERQELLRRFSSPKYKKVAVVVMGEPTSEFKEKVVEATLKEKQEQLEQEWRQRKTERERKKTVELQQKQLEEAKRKAEAAAKAAPPAEGGTEQAPAEGGEKKSDMAEKEEDAKKEEVEGGGKVEVKEEEVKVEEGDSKEEEEVKKEDGDDVDMEGKKAEENEPMPVAQLTEEERKLSFRKKAVTDLTMWVLSTSFAKFSLPTEAEGFDEIRYEWEDGAGAKKYLSEYILRNKVLCRIEDLQPSEWFRTKWGEWQKVLQEWHNKQSEYKDPAKLAEKKAAEDAAKKLAETEKEKNEGEEVEEQEEEPKVEEKMEIDDIFAVEDVCNVGKGEPLFARFTFEDWALLSLRLELHLLVHAFKKDVSDPERIGIHETHLPFYYNKYYRKSFNVKYYGVETNCALVEMVKDTVSVNADNMVLEPQLSEDMDSFDIFVKLTEESRRERQRRIDAGDETVKLKFSKPEAVPQQQKGAQQTPRPQQTIVGSTGPAKGTVGKGYYQPRPQQEKGWYAGGAKGSYGKAGGYGGPQSAPLGGKGYSGQQQGYGGGKAYGGGKNYGKSYSK